MKLTGRSTFFATGSRRRFAAETMPTAVAAQVTLLARFYERLGDSRGETSRDESLICRR